MADIRPLVRLNVSIVTEENGRRETGTYGFGDTPIFENVNYGWYMPYGFHTPAAWVGMFAQRYMHEYGATSEDFGRVSVAVRDFAATNPAAFFHGRPITIEDQTLQRRRDVPAIHPGLCCLTPASPPSR